ncbi:MAG: hypothetical protein RLZ57_1181, partial [Actinomycetota bacterium]|jgi:MFS family permease
MGFGLVVPAIPIFARSFGVSNAAVGLIVSAFAAMRFFSGLISGRLIDRFGERMVFAVGVTLVSIFTLLLAFSQNYLQMLIFRTAGGLGSSMFSVSANSVILRSVDDAKRAQVQSIYNSTFLLGGITGPAFGGLLMSISLRAPFLVYAATLFTAGMIAFFFLTATHLDPANNPDEASFSALDALKIPAYRIALISTFLITWVLFGLRNSITPLFVIEELKGTNAVVGYGFGLAALLQTLLVIRAGQHSDTKGRKSALYIGTVIVSLGIATLAFSTHEWMYLLAMAFLGIGGAYLSATPAAIVGDVVKGKIGRVVGAFQMAGDAGMIAGPLVVGWLADIYDFRTAYAATLAIFSILILLAWRLPETRSTIVSK